MIAILNDAPEGAETVTSWTGTAWVALVIFLTALIVLAYLYNSKGGTMVLKREHNSNTKFVVTDTTGTYHAFSFKEAKMVLMRCRNEEIDVSTYIHTYCEVER